MFKHIFLPSGKFKTATKDAGRSQEVTKRSIITETSKLLLLIKAEMNRKKRFFLGCGKKRWPDL